MPPLRGFAACSVGPFRETASAFTLPLRPRAVPAALLLLHLAAPAPPAAGARVERRVDTMGTRLVVEIDAPDRATAVAASESAVRAVEEVNRRLSTWRDDSELSALNRAAAGRPCRLSPELATDLHRAYELWQSTGGAFDPAIGALLDVWAVRGAGRVPTDGELAAAKAASGMRHLTFSGTVTRLQRDGVRLDAGGFGKGVALDAAAAAALRAGATCTRLDFGGQLLVAGDCSPVVVGIADPSRRDRPVLELRLRSGSVATSGNSERGGEVEGVRIGHILDPRSGRPAPDFGSVTVWAADATTADALSTALFVMGPREGLAWVRRNHGVEAVFLVFGAGGPGPKASAGMTAAIRRGTAALGDRAAATTQQRDRLAPPPGGGIGGSP